MDFLVGILGLIIGVAVCIAGLRLFYALLPVWGFMVGFFAGAALVTAVLGDGFLSTTLGFVIGFLVALIFAALAYLYWYVGVLLAAAAAGGVLGTALFASFGVDSSWLLFIIGLIAGALFVIAAFLFRLPVLLVVINTALAGSAIAIGGLLLVLNRIDRDEIGTGALWQKLDENWFLWIVWMVGAAVGFGVQMQSSGQTTLPDERWTKVQPTFPAR